MAILSINPIKMMQVGVRPASFKLVTDQSLVDLTAAGFLLQGLGGNFFQNNDVVQALYNANTTSENYAELVISINSTTGVITLVAADSGELGQAALKNVSDNSLPNVASISGAPTAPSSGKMVSFTDGSGTVGYNPNAFTAKKIAIAGGATVFPIVDANCVTASVIQVTPILTINAVFIRSVQAGNGAFTVEYNADPGAGSFIQYTICNQQ